MKYGLSEEQIQEIKDFIAAYPEVEEAVLFGSRALGTYKEASDVDIALKGKKVNGALAAKLKFDIEEDSYLPFFFDFVGYPTITNEELKNHIDTKGVVIFCRGGGSLPLAPTLRASATPSPGLAVAETLPRTPQREEVEMEGWKETNINDIKSDSPNAMSTGPFGSAISSKYFLAHGVPVIRGGNLSSDTSIRIKDSDYVFLSEDKAKEFERSLVKDGDLVFTCWGTINQIGLIDKKSLYKNYHYCPKCFG